MAGVALQAVPGEFLPREADGRLLNLLRVEQQAVITDQALRAMATNEIGFVEKMFFEVAAWPHSIDDEKS